ncbi:MAG: hypothetical protein R3B54_01170 [Bdellovibrionota bacterium]
MRTLLRFIVILGLLFSSACTLLSKSQGSLFGLPDDTLAALSRIRQTVALLQQDQNAALIASLPNGICPSGVDQLLCDRVAALTVEQRDFLRQFLQSALPSLSEMSAENPHRLRATSDKSLIAVGMSRGIAGMTEPGPVGDILLYGPEVASYSLPRIVALIVQLMLDKAETMLGDWLPVASAFGPFASAQTLAESTSAALSVLSAVLQPLDPSCAQILVSNPSDRVFYAAHAPSHPTGGPEPCGRAWVADGDDQAGLLTDAQAITDLSTGLVRTHFFLQIDNILMDSNAVADLYVMSGDTAISHRAVRRNEFSATGSFQPFEVMADIPIGASVSFRVDWRQSSALGFLGVRVEECPDRVLIRRHGTTLKGPQSRLPFRFPGHFI